MVSNAKLNQVGSFSARLTQAAFSYMRQGWSVLPLHGIRNGACTCSLGSECKSAGKHPILDGGVHSATWDPLKIKRLWQEYPEANIGIATGEVSDLIALDVDPRNGGDDAIQRLFNEIGRLPKTVLSETGGGGIHRLFHYPEAGILTRHGGDGLAGIDLQSDGAYIVAPPSRHISGQPYRWRDGRDPGSMVLADLSEEWLGRLRRVDQPRLAATAKSSKGVVLEGGRNTYLTSRAGALRQAGLSPEAMLAALKMENQEKCQPPLDDDEVAKIAGSVGRYPAGTSGRADEAEAVMQAVLDQRFAGGAHLLRPSDGQFWHYDGTRWAPLAQPVLKGFVLTAIQGMPSGRSQTASLMSQTMSLLEARVAASGDPLRFKGDPLPVINCRNGELWIAANGTVELRPHNAASYLCHRFEVDYDPNATCPQFDAAILGIFANAAEPDAVAQFWDELMGYTMQPVRRIPTVTLGWGPGNNGKTGLLETLVRVMGRDLVTAMPIGNLEKSRFGTAHLMNKLALIDDDVKAGTRLADGELKRLSEEKTVSAEIKFGPQFTFTARTAIFMLFNNPPSLADLSLGMQRRLVVVPFNRVFTRQEVDTGLFNRIWATELPGVLNRFLAGLGRVMARGWKLDPPREIEAAKEKLLRAANPVPAFVQERCQRSGNTYVEPLYAAYQDWAQRAGITIVPQRFAFQRSIESLGFTSGRGNQGPKLHGLSLRT